MTTIENLTEQIAAVTVEENDQGKTVSFAGRALKLDTESDAKDIVDTINQCHGMTSLDLQGNTIGIPAAQAIAKALEKQPQLKKALWKDMFTRRTVDEIPQALSHLSSAVMLSSARLVVLDLSDNAFGPRGLKGVVGLLESPSCYTLRELHLNNNGLGIQGAGMLSDALCRCVENSRRDGTPLRLEVFVCGRNRLENEGAAHVSRFFSALGTLRSVALPQNGIYVEGVRRLCASFLSNKQLREINLEDNSLTESGAECVVACLSLLKEIRVLNLGDCLVRRSGALELASVLKSNCPKLRQLNLGFNEIDLEGGMAIVDAMEKKAELEKVVLNGNMFGEEGCGEIRRKMAELGLGDKLDTLSEDEGEEEDDDDELESASGEEDLDESVKIIKEQNGHQSPSAKSTPGKFFSKPTAQLLIALQKKEENLLSVLPDEPSLDDYLGLFMKICSVVEPGDECARQAACHYVDGILSKATQLCSGKIDEFSNSFLVSLGLLKAEDKKPARIMDISGALVVLQHAVKQSYFPKSTKYLLRFFLSRPLNYVTVGEKPKHCLMQVLYQA